MTVLNKAMAATFGIGAALAGVAMAQTPPPIEYYSSLSAVRSMELSPDGKSVVYLTRSGDQDIVATLNLGTGENKALIDATDLKASGLEFISNDSIVIRVSNTIRKAGYFGQFENSSAFLLPTKGGRPMELLKNSPDLYPAQTGLGEIIGLSKDGKSIFMPAFDGDGRFRVFEVKLRSGQGKPLRESGSDKTYGWVMSDDDEALARLDYDVDQQMHWVRSVGGLNNEVLYEQDGDRKIAVAGRHPNGKQLIYSVIFEDRDVNDIYAMNLDGGETEGPLFSKPGTQIEAVIIDDFQEVIGVRYAGLTPSYGFFDAQLEKDVAAVQKIFKNSAVYLDSWSADFNRLLFLVDGGDSPGNYALYDRAAKNLNGISGTRPDIPANMVAETLATSYPARDGLEIPTVVTWPSGSTAATRQNLPMVVMPHGGPAAYDGLGFDYMAQLFASRGYMVVQPNFRGSTGFGDDFEKAGHGEWGKAMQDDITDGVKHFINQGTVAADRVCIVGWSYGGYAALMGAVKTPDLYRCVVAGAPVTDLPDLAIDSRREQGRNHPAYGYLKRMVGDPKSQRADMEAVSPAYHADKISAPVLLIHGDDDTVVDIRHSNRMESALKRAGKDVTFVKMRNFDHWLSTHGDSVEALGAMESFVREHNPAR